MIYIHIFTILLTITQQNITIIHTPNNATNQACASAPYWNLNICNTSCLTCQTTNNSKCQTCGSGYVRKGDYCILDNSFDIYFHNNYFEKMMDNTEDLAYFKFDGSSNSLSINSTVKICQQNNYNFEMLGLFTRTQSLVLDIRYTQIISTVNISFNCIGLMNNPIFKISIETNGYTIDSQNETLSFRELPGTYYSSNQSNNILLLPSLNSQNVYTIIGQIKKGPFLVNLKQFTIKIQQTSSIKNGFNVDPYWGISDLTILAHQCNTCVTQALTNRITSIGIFTLYVFSCLIPILIIFLLYVYFSSKATQYKKYNKYILQNKPTTIPIKIVDRMINNIKQKDDNKKQKIPARQQKRLFTIHSYRKQQ